MKGLKRGGIQKRGMLVENKKKKKKKKVRRSDLKSEYSQYF